MFELINGLRSSLDALGAVKPNDRALVIVDNDGGAIWLGQLLINVLGAMEAEPVMLVFNPLEMASQEPPVSVAAAMKNASVIFRILNKKSPLVHTTARKEATATGARFYMINYSELDDLKCGLSIVDLQRIKERTVALSQMLTQANTATLATSRGTEITLSLQGRQGLVLHPLSQVIGGLSYYAEAAISPVEGTAEGILVCDMAILDWGYALREPLRCTVKAGKLIDVTGYKEDADRLREIVSTYQNASNIAELGIGTNHMASFPMNGLRRDAARIGTAHIGIGRNNDIGGTTASEIHFDMLMDRATVKLDDTCVLKDGELLL